MRIVFIRVAGAESLARLHRRDGVVVELPSFSKKYRIPHDLAHFVAERELRLATGVFGTLASGGMFDNARVVGGRPRHDAVARSRKILRANGSALTVAELMAGALHHTVERGETGTPIDWARRSWGAVEQRPFPWSEAEIAHATGVLRELGRRWVALPTDGELVETWPDSLTTPVPR